MKLTNFLGQTNRSFASVFLALSLFGFLFPHHANQVKQNHRCEHDNERTDDAPIRIPQMMGRYTSGSIDPLKIFSR